MPGLMLYFREHRWLVTHGQSRFSAYIPADARKREDVSWSLEMEYIAGGAVWRRVREWERPRVTISISSFKGPAKTWKDLERLNFWNPIGEDEDEDDLDFGMDAGFVDIHFYESSDRSSPTWTFAHECIWRVATRNGRWFTVELAALADPSVALQSAPSLVTTDGTVEEAERDVEFWKKNSELYLVENVPFGTVNVCVPRNVKDPEAFALKRAKMLIGVDEPEHVEITDISPGEGKIESWHGDIHVNLHFNGVYED